MKLVGIVGSNAEFSYNRLLLKEIQRRFGDLFSLEILEIKNVPLFNQSEDQTNSSVIQYINRQILMADGVIIATPEHNYTITPALKSTIEWLSFKLHPFENKPVMIVGASYYNQGTSRSQLHLRQIIEAPGVHGIVFPGNEFLLGKAKEAFNAQGEIIDQKTVDYLKTCLVKYVRFVKVLKAMEEDFEEVDAVSGASEKAKAADSTSSATDDEEVSLSNTVDSTSGATEKQTNREAYAIDATSGATKAESKQKAQAIDATSGATEHKENREAYAIDATSGASKKVTPVVHTQKTDFVEPSKETDQAAKVVDGVSGATESSTQQADTTSGATEK